MLDDIKANIRSHFHNQLMRDSYVTPESVKNALLGKEEEANTIISFFTQHNDQYKKKVEAGEATSKTYSRYELTKLRLTQYMKDEYRVSDLPIRQINKVFIENFYLYIIKNHDCSPNTAMKFIQRFRTVVNFAQGTGLITADPFANYKLKFEYIERGYLDKYIPAGHRVFEQEICRYIHYFNQLSRTGKLPFAVHGRMGIQCTRPASGAACKC